MDKTTCGDYWIVNVAPNFRTSDPSESKHLSRLLQIIEQSGSIRLMNTTSTKESIHECTFIRAQVPAKTSRGYAPGAYWMRRIAWNLSLILLWIWRVMMIEAPKYVAKNVWASPQNSEYELPTTTFCWCSALLLLNLNKEERRAGTVFSRPISTKHHKPILKYVMIFDRQKREWEGGEGGGEGGCDWE